MTLKEYLQQANFLDKAINASLEESVKLKQLATASKSFISTNSSIGYGSRVENIVEKITLLEEKINNDIDKYVNLKNKIHSLLENISDIELKTIMKLHYINGHTWEKVAEECYVSLRTVHNMHKKALDLLNVFYLKNPA